MPPLATFDFCEKNSAIASTYLPWLVWDCSSGEPLELQSKVERAGENPSDLISATRTERLTLTGAFKRLLL